VIIGGVFGGAEEGESKGKLKQVDPQATEQRQLTVAGS
jgi:hypothetical protein